MMFVAAHGKTISQNYFRRKSFVGYFARRIKLLFESAQGFLFKTSQKCTNARAFCIVPVTSYRAKIQPFDSGKNAKRPMQAFRFDNVFTFPAIISLAAESVSDFKSVFRFHA